MVDLINQAEKSEDFSILKTQITHKTTGAKFLFLGLRATGGKTAMSQINKVKGVHKISFVFFEEGQDLSADSLDVLIPTATRSGSVLLHKKKKAKFIKSDTRFFVAMNPNREADPVILKFKPYVDAGRGVILHLNMMDIIEDEPKFKDDQLVNQMELERNEFYFDHVWLGAPFHLFAGLPFSDHLFEDLNGDFSVHISFIDPSFKGGDYTAIAFLASQDGRAFAFGSCFKQAWNMSPALDNCVALMKKHKPERMIFEDNSLGNVPMKEYARHGLKLQAFTNMINKEDRIYKASAFTKNLITFAPNLCNSVFIEHIKGYSDTAEFDDGADAFASAVNASGIIRDKIKF